MADSDRHSDLDDEDRFEDEGRRSIFSALWFRAILVVVVLGVVAAVAVPYLLEWANPQPPQPTSAARPGGMSPPAPPPAPLSPPAPAPPVAAAPPPAVERPEPAASPAAAAPEKPPAPKEKPATPAKKSEPTRTAAAKEPPASRPPTATAGGTYFVQVGAFKDPDAARRLAARLRELKFDVDESSTHGAPAARSSAAPSTGAPAAGSDKYDVYVSGGVPSEISAKLSAKGLSVEQSGSGLVVKPSLPLRDAVALSKDLAVDGLKVQVRRAGGGASAPPASSAPATSGETFYRVRVGPFDARADATSAMQDLEKRGYKPFIARAGQ